MNVNESSTTYYNTQSSTTAQLPDGVSLGRSWGSGPLRYFAAQRPKNAGNNWIAQAGGGFAGAYVCDECVRPSIGVYYVPRVGKWLCRHCKNTFRPPTIMPRVTPAGRLERYPG
jgi:hypothetical protein